MPRIRKKTSKRGTTHQRARIKHKVSESHKKKKKETKKDTQWKSKHKKDPGIPNNFPFKEQILAEVAESRRQAEEKKQKKKENKKAAKLAVTQAQDGENEASNEESEVPVLKPAPDGSTVPKTRAPDDDDDAPILLDPELPNLKAVLDTADLFLEVLDARDPLPYRSPWLQKQFTQRPGTLHAFILHKIDRAPKESLSQWSSYLRSESATVLCRAPKACYQLEDGKRPKTQSMKEFDSIKEDAGIGFDALKECLQTWADKKAKSGSTSSKEAFKVAFVGIANSGKSTIINTLYGKNICPMYSPSKPKPGFSTTPYPIRVVIEVGGHKIELIDTPALMRQTPDDTSPDDLARIRVRDMLLRNKGKIDKVKEPIPAVEYVLSRANKEDLMLLYNLPVFADDDVNGFLRALARVTGFIKKKGILDLAGAARVMLRDWSLGKFPYFTLPTQQPNNGVAESDALSSIYERFDHIALSSATASKHLWSTTGLVKFDPETVDERAIVLVPPAEQRPKDDTAEMGEDDEEAWSGVEGSADEVDESGEEIEEDTEEVKILATPGKRKRTEALPRPSQGPQTKKVAFAPSVSKKDGRPRNKAQKPSLQVKPVKPVKPKGDSNRVSKLRAPDSKEEAYDFSHFF